MRRTCAHCGGTFEPQNFNSKHCSLDCRFWSKVRRGGPDDCWEWQGAKQRGYGQFNHAFEQRANRVAWLLSRGVSAGEMLVLHRCDNPSCVNPRHLFLGTQDDNMADMSRKGRSCRGEGRKNTTLTERDVIAIRRDPRPASAVAADFGVSHKTVGSIRRRENWRHVA